MQKAIQEILVGNNLTRQQSCEVMDQIMRGEATDAQLAALLVGLKMKGETVDEIAGFVDSMRAHSLKVLIDDHNAIDGCGTGGDGSHTFNISTAAALVAAAGGATVAKHGNRSVSSKCGSADLLEATGGKIDPGPEIVTDTINQIRFGFMFAPRFHPAMKHAVPVRKELGVRTAFNILGPMTNPAGVKRQVIGVYDDSLMDLMAEVLRATSSEHVIVVRSKDGLDEFSVAAPSEFRELRNGTIEKH